MALEPDPRGYADLIGYVATGALSVFAWLFNRVIGKHDEELKSFKEQLTDSVQRQEWIDARMDARADRDRMREQIAELYRRDDQIKESVGAKIDQLKERMDLKLEEMRDDMNGGLNRLGDKIDALKD